MQRLLHLNDEYLLFGDRVSNRYFFKVRGTFCVPEGTPSGRASQCDVVV
jgi:hypothetical protein